MKKCYESTDNWPACFSRHPAQSGNTGGGQGSLNSQRKPGKVRGNGGSVEEKKFSHLIGSRILGLHSGTSGIKDYIFTNCKDYKLGWTGELGVRQGTKGMRKGMETGIRE